MEVRINKEINDYSESIFFGLNMRQCFFSFIACLVAVGIYFLTIDVLGTELTSWLCMIGAAPFAALGFVKYQGMNAEQIVVVAWRSFLLSKRDLIDQPVNLYYDQLDNYFKRKKKEAISKNDKKFSKIKKTKQRKI